MLFVHFGEAPMSIRIDQSLLLANAVILLKIFRMVTFEANHE